MTPPVIFQIGSQHSLHATEAAYRDGYTAAGCVVLGVTQDECLQRGQTWLYDRVREADAALLVYSRTHSPSALTPDWTALWRRLEAEGTQTAGTHLDVFWGIPEREQWIRSGDPMFTLGIVFTADGGSDDKWAAVGVNHHWLPPGCDTRFIPDNPQPIAELAGKIVFVGSAYGYHSEHAHRMEMIAFAKARWPERLVIYGNGSPNGAVRGVDLAHIYASDCLAIGDFCFAGQTGFQWSDRVPETLGRGGLLLVTDTPGLTDWYDDEADLLTWKAGDFDGLAALVDEASEWTEGFRNRIRSSGRAVVHGRDTYRHRARTILDTVGVNVALGE